MDNYLEKIKKEAKMSFIVSFLLIALAIVLLINPDNFIVVSINVLGYIGIFFGIISVFTFFLKPKEEANFLRNGVILVLYGIIAIIESSVLKNVITIILGSYIILRNAYKLEIAWHLKTREIKEYMPILFISAINIILGLTLVINPTLNIPANTFIAILIIICEVLSMAMNIIIIFSKKKENKQNE